MPSVSPKRKRARGLELGQNLESEHPPVCSPEWGAPHLELRTNSQEAGKQTPFWPTAGLVHADFCLLSLCSNQLMRLMPLLPWWYIQHRNQPTGQSTERKNPQNYSGVHWPERPHSLTLNTGPDKLSETQSLRYRVLPALCPADSISKVWAIRLPEVQSENLQVPCLGFAISVQALSPTFLCDPDHTLEYTDLGEIDMLKLELSPMRNPILTYM